MVIVKGNMKAGKVACVFGVNTGYQMFGRNAFLLCPQHDGRAMGVVGAHVVALVPVHFLETYPDIGLYVFDQVSKVDSAIGVRQGAGN